MDTGSNFEPNAHRNLVRLCELQRHGSTWCDELVQWCNCASHVTAWSGARSARLRLHCELCNYGASCDLLARQWTAPTTALVKDSGRKLVGVQTAPVDRGFVNEKAEAH